MAKRSKRDEIHDKYQETTTDKQGVRYERLTALVMKSLEEKGAVVHDRKLPDLYHLEITTAVVASGPIAA